MLSPQELCDWIPGLTTRSLQELRSNGGGPPYVAVTRTAIVYPANTTLEWIEARAQSSTGNYESKVSN